MTPEQKTRIDEMSQMEMARLWRFAASSHELLSGDTGDYFAQSFKEKSWFTPEISKALGWE